MNDDDVIRLVVDDDDPPELFVSERSETLEPELVPAEVLPVLPEDASTVQRVEHLLLKALVVLEQGARWQDGRLALSAIREARACLELTAKLSGELAQAAQVAVVNVVNEPQDFEGMVEEALALIREVAHPQCARCGAACSECHSELLPLPAVRPVERPVAPLQVLPPPACPDGCGCWRHGDEPKRGPQWPGPVSVR